MRILSDARSANVTSRLAINTPVCDGDGYVKAIRRGGSVGDSPCPPSPPHDAARLPRRGNRQRLPPTPNPARTTTTARAMRTRSNATSKRRACVTRDVF